MEPQHALVPHVASAKDSGRGVFDVDALVVFQILPDAGFDFAQLERAGLSKHAVDAAGLMLPKVGALLCELLMLCVVVFHACVRVAHAVLVRHAVGFARVGGACKLFPAMH